MTRPVLYAIAALVALLLLGGILSQCTSLFTTKTENRVLKGQGQAGMSAGQEAMNTVSNVAQADAETDRTVKAATAEVRAAPAGNSNAQAQRGACSMKSYRNTERCNPKVTK